jgi:2-polyprenyl-3-methyl-5-hydroxy-6-metoxy-1,4-benzoquinol methylase
VNPRPDKEEIQGFYPEGYAAHAETSGPSHDHRLGRLRRRLNTLFYNYPDGETSRRIFIKGILWPLKWVMARHTIPFQGDGRILDIGAGSGSFLACMKALGWDVYGVDVNPNAAERARCLGVRMFQGEVEEAAFPDRFFDVITLRAVLEHVHHPVETLGEVRRILKDQGMVYIVVPNIASLSFWIFGGFWYGLDLPRHLYAYSPKAMRRLAERTGFKILSVRFRSSTLGFRGSLQYWYDDWRGKKGTYPFMTNRGIRLAGKVWRGATDLVRLGDTAEYKLRKAVFERST